jgi:large subunit ribosomal protein L3
MSSATGMLGRKVGMTQIFTETGNRVPVTVIECGPCKVLQVKTDKTDGYFAIQLGFADRKEKNTSKALVGHCDKAGSGPKHFVREIRLNAAPEDKVGDELTVAVLEKFRYVDVSGICKGKGYQGVMKRHHFHGLPASHGCSKRHRSPGGLGRQYSINKGVPKGKKMPGHLGADRVTVPGLQVVRCDAANNLLLVKGAIPGANGTYVQINKAIREKEIMDAYAKRKK